ncbi:hypothetical protein P8452_30116 [Trifolium repens]|nr:hypothetical protein P8452_30116 [Trifolium repens]
MHLSKSSLAAYLDSLKGSRWSIFVVRGNIPKEFPISLSESSNRFGKWLSPKDAERINKSFNSGHQTPQKIVIERQHNLTQMLLPFNNSFLWSLLYGFARFV